MSTVIPTKEGKIERGLAKIGFATITESEQGDVYGPVVVAKGAREFSAEPQGDPLEIYADSGLYYSEDTNDGYEISLTMVRLLDSLGVDIMGETLDATTKMQLEYSNSTKKRFALVVQMLDDQRGTVHVFYDCKASKRPTIASKTKEKTVEPQFPQFVIRVKAREADGLVRSRTTKEVSKDLYDSLFTTVFDPLKAVALGG